MSQAPGKWTPCAEGHHECRDDRRGLARGRPLVHRQLGPQTEFDPDLVVVRMDQVGGAKFTEPPLLAVEIRSPSTALVGLSRKKSAYERYWVVNPEPPDPELAVFELRDGRYVLVATASGPLAVDRPFAMTIDTARLTDGLRR